MADTSSSSTTAAALAMLVRDRIGRDIGNMWASWHVQPSTNSERHMEQSVDVRGVVAEGVDGIKSFGRGSGWLYS